MSLPQKRAEVRLAINGKDYSKTVHSIGGRTDDKTGDVIVDIEMLDNPHEDINILASALRKLIYESDGGYCVGIIGDVDVTDIVGKAMAICHKLDARKLK